MTPTFSVLPMLHQITSSELATMDRDARLKALGALADAAKSSNGAGTAYLKNRVRQFELRYEMSSEEMLERLKDGRQKETAAVAKWLFYLDALRAHAR